MKARGSVPLKIKGFNLRINLLMAGFAISLWLPLTASAQCDTCGQGTFELTQLFGTNSFGAPVPGLAHPGDTVGIQIKVLFANECALAPCLQGDQSVITNVTISMNDQGISFNPGNLLTTNLWPPVPDSAHILNGRYPVMDVAYPPANAGGSRTASIVGATTGPYAYLAAATFTIPLACTNSLLFTTVLSGYSTNNNLGKNNGLQYSAGMDIGLRLICPRLCVGMVSTNNGLTGADEIIGWTAYVTNCGDALVNNIFVTNHFDVVPPGHTQDERVAGPITLLPNTVSTITGSYSPAGVSLNTTIAASGQDELFSPVSASVNSASALPLRPVIQSILKTANSVTLVTTARPGKAYRLQFKADLNPNTDWSNLPPDVVTSSTFVTNVDSAIGTSPMRLYRVVELP